MSNHTEGPWRICDYTNRPNERFIENDACEIAIVNVFDENHISDANARLIAAAPEMAQRIEELEAQVAAFVDEHKRLHKYYRRVVDRFSEVDCYDNHADKIQGMIQVQEDFEINKVVKRAIAKAKGEQA